MKEKVVKMYVNMENLNGYEREQNKISYAKLIKKICNNNIWLFNQAPKLSNYDFDFVVNSDYDEETDETIDVYQYYLIDIDDYMLEKLQELKIENVIIAWSETLEEYVLMVTHFGTSWDYVLTDIEPTDNYDEADL